jgi:iron complex transport system substrate-binding protein
VIYRSFCQSVLCASVIFFTACNEGRGASRETVGAQTSALSASSLRWAKSVEWQRKGNRIDVTITRPWKGAREPLRYTLLLPEEASASTNTDSKSAKEGSKEIRLPVRRIACLASVHVGYLKALNATGTIIAVDAANHIYDKGVRNGVKSGKIFEAGSGAQMNVERLLAAKPDLVVANAVGVSEYQALQRLTRAGIPVLVTAEWMEDHPLARAEWVRLFGVLLGKEREGDSLFTAIETSYLQQAKVARAKARHPTVLIGGPFRDQWFVSGGRSFMARFLEDAGGDYLWKNDTTAGGVPLSFETVLTKARTADLWLYPGDFTNHWNTLGDGTRQDTRFSSFDAFLRGDVYGNDARRLPDGANDYWESGNVNPHRMLADLISIFHGTEDSLFYHRRIPPGP